MNPTSTISEHLSTPLAQLDLGWLIYSAVPTPIKVINCTEKTQEQIVLTKQMSGGYLHSLVLVGQSSASAIQKAATFQNSKS